MSMEEGRFKDSMSPTLTPKKLKRKNNNEGRGRLSLHATSLDKVGPTGWAQLAGRFWITLSTETSNMSSQDSGTAPTRGRISLGTTGVMTVSVGNATCHQAKAKLPHMSGHPCLALEFRILQNHPLTLYNHHITPSVTLAVAAVYLS